MASPSLVYFFISLVFVFLFLAFLPFFFFFFLFSIQFVTVKTTKDPIWFKSRWSAGFGFWILSDSLSAALLCTHEFPCTLRCLPSCPSLVSLNISGNPSVTSAGLQSILTSLREASRPLTLLNLQGTHTFLCFHRWVLAENKNRSTSTQLLGVGRDAWHLYFNIFLSSLFKKREN